MAPPGVELQRRIDHLLGEFAAQPLHDAHFAELEGALQRSDRAKGGRPPYDPVMMFRVLVLQTGVDPVKPDTNGLGKKSDELSG